MNYHHQTTLIPLPSFSDVPQQEREKMAPVWSFILQYSKEIDHVTARFFRRIVPNVQDYNEIRREVVERLVTRYHAFQAFMAEHVVRDQRGLAIAWMNTQAMAVRTTLNKRRNRLDREVYELCCHKGDGASKYETNDYRESLFDSEQAKKPDHLSDFEVFEATDDRNHAIKLVAKLYEKSSPEQQAAMTSYMAEVDADSDSEKPQMTLPERRARARHIKRLQPILLSIAG